MTLHYPRPSRERILAFGYEGTGKSYIGCHMAARVASTHPDSPTVHVVETDPAWDRMMEDPDFAVLEDLYEAGKLVIHKAYTWPTFAKAMSTAWSGVTNRDDLIIVDNITRPWPQLRDWYWEQILDEPRGSFLLAVRKAEIEALRKTNKGKGDAAPAKPAEQDFEEWNTINPTWTAEVANRIQTPPCHLYMTAWATDYVEIFDDKNADAANLYRKLGAKPAGQKATGTLTQTVLYLSKTKVGDYRMTTIKDRSRPERDRQTWSDFDEYLTDAGWVEGAPWETTTQPNRRRRGKLS